jgi:hypothetical protein
LAFLTVAFPSMMLGRENAWRWRSVIRIMRVPKLPNPSRDAISVGQLFRDAGFDSVDVIVNVSNIEFKRHPESLNSTPTAGRHRRYFYAGHGLEIKRHQLSDSRRR